MPQSSTSAVFTQLAGCLHSLHDAIKGEQRLTHQNVAAGHGVFSPEPARLMGRRVIAERQSEDTVEINLLLDFTLLCSLSVCPEMSKHYNQKAVLEQELPTVTQKLLTTSECLLGSLGSLASSTGKVRPPGGGRSRARAVFTGTGSFCSWAVMWKQNFTIRVDSY